MWRSFLRWFQEEHRKAMEALRADLNDRPTPRPPSVPREACPVSDAEIARRLRARGFRADTPDLFPGRGSGDHRCDAVRYLGVPRPPFDLSRLERREVKARAARARFCLGAKAELSRLIADVERRRR